MVNNEQIVLFNAFETLCFPQCITNMSQVYFLSVHVRKSCKYINFAVRSTFTQVDELLCACALNRRSAIILSANMHFMIAVTVKGLL